MSNPLLRANDPRFQRPDMRDAAGNNRFADDANTNSPPETPTDVYAPTAAQAEQPYTARYPEQQKSRARLLVWLGGVGWGAAVGGALSFTGWFDLGWFSPFLGLGPAGAAWFLAHEELKAIRAGAISSLATEPARHAYWLGLTGVIACILVVVTMIYHGMNILPA